MVGAYAPNCSLDYPVFFESLAGVPSGDPKVLLGDFSTHVVHD